MGDEHRLANPQLFAGWAGEDFGSWEQAIGTSVTHVSRGRGQIINVTREAGVISVHVQYARSVREHATWEIRTEIRDMTLPLGYTRDQLIPAARAQRILHEQGKQARHAAQSVPERRKKR